MTSHDWAQEQLKDPVIKKILDLKVKSLWADISHEGSDFKCLWGYWDALEVKNGVLCRTFHQDRKVFTQIVVPRDMRKDIIKMVHGNATGGHQNFGENKGQVFWPNCRVDVTLHSSTCDLCSARRPPKTCAHAQMQQYNVGIMGEQVALGSLGPFPSSSNGSKYSLVIGDYFSKFIEAYAIPDQEAVTVARTFVNEYVSRYGVPRIVHTDQGKNFESKLFREMCGILGIEKTRTTAQ